MTTVRLEYQRLPHSCALAGRSKVDDKSFSTSGRAHHQRLLLGVSSLVLLALPFGLATPASAACSNNAPASGTSVICDTTAPNPDPQGVQAQAGSTNVTVTVDSGASISAPLTPIWVYSDSTVTNNGSIAATDPSASAIQGAGILAEGDNNVLTNNGSITSAATTTSYVGGIAAYGSNNVITNSAGAMITTNGADANGMKIDLGNNSTSINNGTIITNGNGNGPAPIGVSTPIGMDAVGNGHAVTNNGTIETNGSWGIGIFGNGADQTLTNTGRIDTAGEGGYGVWMDGSTSEVNNSGTITTAGVTAHGARIEGDTNTLTNTGTITTTADTTDGVFIAGDGNAVNNSGTIEVAGVGSSGIHVASTAGQANGIINQAAGVISAPNGSAIFGGDGNETVDNAGALIGGNGQAVNLGAGTDALTLRSTSVVQGLMDGGMGADTLTFDGFAYTGGSEIMNWETFNLTNGSALTLNNNLVMGDSISLTGIVGIDSTSAINAFADYAIQAFDAASLVTVNNAGALNLSNGTAGNALTIVGNYVGQGGRLVLDTVLARDGAPSDKLVIDRGAATGNTSLVINNAGGAGALTTGDGIKVVEAINGGTTAPDAFALAGRVAAGAFDYTLFRSGATTPDDWYLRSTRVDPGPGPGPGETPNYRPEVPLDMAVPNLAQEFGFAMLDTRQERIGAEIYDGYGLAQCDDPTRKFRDPASMPQKAPLRAEPSCPRYRVWARVFGETGQHKEGSFWSGHGPTYDYGLAGFQAGIELYRRENADGSRDILGAYLGAGRAEGDVEHVFGGPAGDISFDGYSAGAYWTHFGASGWYVDGVLQGTWFDEVKARSVAGQGIGTQGSGLAASLEGGYPIHFGDRWVIEPQAQIIYQQVALDGTADSFGLVSFADSDAWRARIGARLAKSFVIGAGGRAPRLLTAYARANVWHGFGDDATTTFANLQGFNAVALTSDLRGTWAQIGAGMTGQVTEAVTLFASGDYNFSIDGGKSSSVGGRAGIKVVW